MMEEMFIEVDSTDSSENCRCCFSFIEPMDNIFECIFNDLEFHEILNIVAPICIQADDGHSQLICETCKAKAIEAFCFRETCVATDKRIKFLSESKYKTEDCDDNSIQQLEEEYEEDEDLSEIGQDTEEFLMCSLCQEMFKSSSDLAAHIASGHQFENEIMVESCFVCDVCNATCSSESAIESHMQSHVEGVSIEVVNTYKPIREVRSLTKGEKGKKHECHVCDKRFETPSKLKRHFSVHRDILDPSEIPQRPRKEYKYECKFCGRRTETPSKMNRHMQVHEKVAKTDQGINQFRPLACSDCDKRFWDKVKLDRHRIIHSEAFERSKIYHSEDHLFTCVICLQQVPDYDNCIDHMKEHREELGENTEVECKLCSKVYPKLSNLIRHSRAHVENATHRCVHCKKMMGMGDDLIDHMLRHDGFKPFLCDINSCGKSFIKLHKLKQHMLTHQENAPKNFQCGQCDKSFAESEYLKRHELRHSGRKDHACKLCPARFAFSSGLRAHITTHSKQKSFECEICSSKFTKLQSLKIHMKSHTGEKKYHCVFCPKKFITSSHLNRHNRCHTGERPHQCNHCEKSFTQSNDLMKHLKTHIGPNVYKCEIADCLAAFEKFNDLKNHKLMHFNGGELMREEVVYGADLDSLRFM